MKSYLFLIIIVSGIVVISSFSYANSWIPPTNAFDKIHSDNGTINAVNSSMPLNIKGGIGINVDSSNLTHTLTISSSVGSGTGSYNTTQANNVTINSGGSKLNFINGTGATVHLQNSGAGNQVNVTVSATGVSSGVTSLNALTGALTIVCVSGNTTCTTSGGNTITVNTAYNVVVTGGSAQTITKGITHTADVTMSGANINLGSNILKTTNYNLFENTPSGANGIVLQPSAVNHVGFMAIAPSGKNRNAGLLTIRTSDVTTNFEVFALQTDPFSTHEFSIRSYKAGNGTLNPIDVIMNSTKLISFDTANTITHYVDTLFKTKITQYNSINTAGWGVPAIYGSGRLTGLTGASGNVTSYTVGASDGTFQVTGDLLATTSTTYGFTYDVLWTDEGGTARTLHLLFTTPTSSSPVTSIQNSLGPTFEGLEVTIHAKAGTKIALRTDPAGTYTTVTYNIDGIIKQIS